MQRVRAQAELPERGGLVLHPPSGASFASTCLADPISKQFVASILDFAAERAIPVVRFLKGQRKDDVAHEHLARFTEPEGIYMIGVEEKTSTFRTEKRRNPETGAPYPWIVRASALVNQYYAYGLDLDFGPFFLKFSISERRYCGFRAYLGRTPIRPSRGKAARQTVSP